VNAIKTMHRYNEIKQVLYFLRSMSQLLSIKETSEKRSIAI